MSIWIQKEEDVVSALVPDGKTSCDVYSTFDFSGSSIPYATTVKFSIGSCNLYDTDGNKLVILTEAELLAKITAVPGISLLNESSNISTCSIKDQNGVVSPVQAAKATINPIPRNASVDDIVVVAYCSYDLSGGVTRFFYQFVNVPISLESGTYLSEKIISLTSFDAPSIDSAGCFYETANDGVSNKLFKFGGYNSLGFVSVGEKYGTAWSRISDIPVALAYGTCSNVNGNLYLAGGVEKNGLSSSFFKYDPKQDTWEEMEQLPFPLAYHSSCVYGTYIYLSFGALKIGRNKEPERYNPGILRYDVNADSWTLVDAIIPSGVSTTLSSSALRGDYYISIPASSQLPPSGFVTLGRGTIDLTLYYTGFDNGYLSLYEALPADISIGETLDQASLSYSRIGHNSYCNGSIIRTFNGISSSLSDGTSSDYLSESYDLSLKTITPSLLGPSEQRFNAGFSSDGTNGYIVGGATQNSDWTNSVESVDLTTGLFTTETPLDSFRQACAVVCMAGEVYVFSGYGASRDSSWVRIVSSSQPSQMISNGIQDSAISFYATDAAGKTVPNGTTLDVSAVLVAVYNDIEKGRVYSEPVLFSDTSITTLSGRCSTILKPRAEDYISAIENLIGQTTRVVQVGQENILYRIIIKASVNDPVLYGKTNEFFATEQLRIGNPYEKIFPSIWTSAQQGNSASVDLVTKTASMAKVETIISESPSALFSDFLNKEKDEIPFGSSPLFDGISEAASAMIPLPNSPPYNMIVSVGDGDENKSSQTTESTISQVNSIGGTKVVPAFNTVLNLSKPVSMASRSNTADVPSLEKISSETGGDSYTILDSSYIQTVIDRIKADSESSIGRGTITIDHDVEGSLLSIEYTVSNLISGNTAEMRVWYSTDGREFSLVVDPIPPNIAYYFSAPIPATVLRYEINISSTSFSSPILSNVTATFISPTKQYIFTNPITVSGEVTELAGITNARIDSQAYLEMGLSHGTSVNYDRDFKNEVQAPIATRGSIMAISRSVDSVLDGGVSTSDIMDSEDLLVYTSRGGPWAQDAGFKIYADGIEVSSSNYKSIPEEGIVIFDSKRSSLEEISLSVTNKTTFRVGIKYYNPTLTAGKFDSFAYMFGETEKAGALNQLPRAVNVYISPSTVRPGGPLTANYTYLDPEGNTEDTGATEIIWYRDGKAVEELRNKRTVSDNNLLASPAEDYKIIKDQIWFFTVRPSDGTNLGKITRSSPVVIQNSFPSVSGVSLSPSTGTHYLASVSINVNYDYYDRDEDDEGATIIDFYADGVLVQSGITPTLSSSAIDASGEKIIKANKQIAAVVTPYDGTNYGTPTASNTIVVEYSTPSATGVSITPEEPSSAETLTLNYVYSDPDVIGDSSKIVWRRNGKVVSGLNNTKTVSPIYTVANDTWEATITPSNGVRDGTAVTSEEVVITF